MAHPTRRVQLRPGDRQALEQWVRSRTTPQRQVERAHIVLGAAEGESGYALSERLGVSRPTVQRWLDRYEGDGLAALEDRPRSGRPRKVTPAVEAEVVRKTLEEKVSRGTHWSTRLMAKEAGLHATQISRIWRSHGLKPHRVKTFKLSRDPRFVEKLRDVVGLYMAPPERAIVFSHRTRRARFRHWIAPNRGFRSRRGAPAR